MTTPTPPTSSTTDVLIVGAGPTGSALAIDLARRGISVRVIDKATRGFPGSRAKGLQPRTLEVLYDLGALPDITAGGSLYPPMGLHLGPVTVPLRMMAKGQRGPDIPFPDTWLIPQSRTNQALHDVLESHGVCVESDSELADFTDSGTSVIAHVVSPRGREEVNARYVVGADGGSSVVRKQAGIEFTGSTDDADRTLIIDATVAGKLSRKYWHVWPGLGGRFIGACPLPHSDLFQWMIRLAPDEEAPSGIDAINARIQSHTRNKHLSITSISWESVFRPNIRLAERYRRGRVLLAGDAAHVHPPAGAQGLNTGIGDAYNLGWKLAQVLAGAPESLLDTYEQERRPIAAGVLGLSTKKYEGIGKLDPSSYRRGSDEKQLTLTYRGGPLAPSAADHTATLRVGDRAPDADLLSRDGDRVRLFDAYRGTHFTALAYGPHAATSLAALRWPVTGAPLQRLRIDAGTSGPSVHPREEGPATGDLVDTSGGFRQAYGVSGDTLLVIRPDGYIGHIAQHDLIRSTQAVIDTLTPAAEGAVA
ncbi:FAD-dependent oxidoreductase [Mycolicibacterium sp. J2]|uniref:FAD-dependent oxidoreductase n=1 Tax=Mycolicibacterium sp. J2 TaxID=2993511 RepID=UPI00224ABBA2|nr:FAD-dependent oxidoreductase [Mycolicibacterium sp. J2]MCX2712903.1 FAD-dependent monooxygenase [Mycolicibacterium sp. J2]